MAVTQVTSNSLLPLPVVPPTTACGPDPTRSSDTSPWSPTPMTQSRPRAGPASPPGRRPARSASATVSGSVLRSPASPLAAACSRSMNAKTRACSMAIGSGRNSDPHACATERTISARPGPCTRTTLSQPAGSPSAVSATAMTIHAASGPASGIRPASLTTMRCAAPGQSECGSAAVHSHPGGAGCRPALPGGKAKHSCTSSPRATALARTSGPMMPIPPRGSAAIGIPVSVAAQSRSSRCSAGSAAPSSRRPLAEDPVPRATWGAGDGLQRPASCRADRMPLADGVRCQASRRSSSWRSATAARTAQRASE
jgi:hypothetical protein